MENSLLSLTLDRRQKIMNSLKLFTFCFVSFLKYDNKNEKKILNLLTGAPSRIHAKSVQMLSETPCKG